MGFPILTARVSVVYTYVYTYVSVVYTYVYTYVSVVYTYVSVVYTCMYTTFQEAVHSNTTNCALPHLKAY
jgi:hypothetical protein